MVSEMAVEDIAQMRADGVAVTDRDVIRLNALALRVERNPDAARTSELPRVAFLGDVAFREPSLAAELWMVDAGRHFDCRDSATFLALRAYSLTRTPDELPDPLDLRKVRGAVRAFCRRDIGAFTVRQVMAAIEYATEGSDPAWGEHPAPDPGAKPAADGGERIEASEAGILADGVALKLGTLRELSRLTESQVLAMIHAKIHSKGAEDDGWKSRTIQEYERTKEEIRFRTKVPIPGMPRETAS